VQSLFALFEEMCEGAIAVDRRVDHGRNTASRNSSASSFEFGDELQCTLRTGASRDFKSGFAPPLPLQTFVTHAFGPNSPPSASPTRGARV
jgi:hypothetical protein